MEGPESQDQVSPHRHSSGSASTARSCRCSLRSRHRENHTINLGPQPETVHGARLFVLPSEWTQRQLHMRRCSTFRELRRVAARRSGLKAGLWALGFGRPSARHPDKRAVTFPASRPGVKRRFEPSPSRYLSQSPEPRAQSPEPKPQATKPILMRCHRARSSAFINITSGTSSRKMIPSMQNRWTNATMAPAAAPCRRPMRSAPPRSRIRSPR